jgi:beta-phosphoglucomutase family hydrolase
MNADSRPKAVLWDMDGTLIDSASVHFQAWKDTLAEADYELDQENFAAYFGRRNDDIIRAYLGARATPERMERISRDKEVRYRAWVRRDGIALLPGVHRWLKRLHADGWRQAIASSAPRLNVEAVLGVAGVAEYFSAIVAAEDVTISKPDPEVYVLAAARLGAPPSRCVVVEDAPAGIEGARRAGMRSVGICALHDLAADRAVHSMEELEDEAFDRLLAT